MDKAELVKEGIYYPIKLDYYKTEHQIQEENEKVIKYGIEVVKTKVINKQEIIENELISNITVNEQDIEKILNIMKQSQVTPVIAPYIVEDLLNKNWMSSFRAFFFTKVLQNLRICSRILR